MLSSDPNKIAQSVLRKLANYYSAKDIEEVVLNRPGQVWLKFRGKGWMKDDAAELSYEYMSRVCNVLANINGSVFSETGLPVVSCELPGAPFRFQAIMGPNVRYDLEDRKGIAVAIRALTADTSISFASYGLTRGVVLPGADAKIKDFSLSEDHIQALAEVIERRETIVVSGATSTGKTTFTNRLIEMIDRRFRVITVEDAIELTVPHLNRVRLLVPRNMSANKVGYPVIINSLVRLTPDWIICGELSIENAEPIYSIMGKGHPVITTVHSDSPDQAVAAFANNMSLAKSDVALSGEKLYESIKSQIGAIIQLERRNEQRSVTEIAFPSREIARERNSKKTIS